MAVAMQGLLTKRVCTLMCIPFFRLWEHCKFLLACRLIKSKIERNRGAYYPYSDSCLKRRKAAIFDLYRDISLWHSSEIFYDVHFTASFRTSEEMLGISAPANALVPCREDHFAVWGNDSFLMFSLLATCDRHFTICAGISFVVICVSGSNGQKRLCPAIYFEIDRRNNDVAVIILYPLFSILLKSNSLLLMHDAIPRSFINTRKNYITALVD